MSAVMAELTTVWCSLSSSTVMETGFTCFYTSAFPGRGKHSYDVFYVTGYLVPDVSIPVRIVSQKV